MPLILSRLKEQLSYDQTSGIFAWRIKKSRNSYVGSIAGVTEKRGYRRIRIDGIKYSAARLAWFYVYGDWPKNQIDHINGVRDDDRLCNLRMATAAENSTNRKGWSGTGIKGVHKQRNGTYWAKIGVDGKVLYLGTYADINEAAAVRKAVAIRLQGNFASELR